MAKVKDRMFAKSYEVIHCVSIPQQIVSGAGAARAAACGLSGLI